VRRQSRQRVLSDDQPTEFGIFTGVFMTVFVLFLVFIVVKVHRDPDAAEKIEQARQARARR
jgi:hypothetical protein